jgi:YtcA family
VRPVVNMYAFTQWRLVHPRPPMSCPARLLSAVLLLGQAFCLTGCGGAPSVAIAGAYFPAWLLCAVIGVMLAALIRGLMVATGLANHIPYQLLVCCSIGAIFALILWHVWVVR